MLGNYKIRVNNEAESKESQELFFDLGYYWNNRLGVKNLDDKFLYVKNNKITSGYCSDNFSDSVCCELTLPQLRDLVARSKPTEQGLINRADALQALVDGKEVEFKCGGISWRLLDVKQQPLEILIDQKVQFRIKPRTIKFELEIPKPFKPKVGEFVFYLDGSCKDGFDFYEYDGIDLGNPLWRSSEEIKQVVEVLRNSVKGVDNV